MAFKYKETEIFHFHNANPKGKNASDCVVRAISVALNQTWEDTMREMTEMGIKLGYAFNEDKLIDPYLKSKGWDKFKEPRDLKNKKISVAQFLKDKRNQSGVLIVKVGSHHVSLIVDGVVWDTWDCTSRTMHTYFRNPIAKTPIKEKRRFTL